MVVFTCRPGRMGALDEDAQLVGVPSYVPSAPAGTPAEYFFAILAPDVAEQPVPGSMMPAQVRVVGTKALR